MDQLGFRFTRLQVDHPKDVFEVSTMRMGHVLYDVLSPVASGLIIDFGFAPVFHFDADSKEHKQFVVDLKPDVWPEDEEIQTIGDIMLAKSTKVVRTREQDEQGESQLVLRQIGGLMLAIPAAKDEPSRPTLAAYYLNRKAVASLMADGVLDLARDSLGEIIKELGVELNKEPLSKSTWFMALQSAVQRSGIRWVVASPAEHEEQPEGQPPITLDPDLTELQLEALFAEPLATLHAADLPVKHIIRLVLPKSKYRLFLGIERTGFGPELNFDSPWRVFLSDLAKVSDAALDVLKTQQAVQMALENENVITIALLSGAIMHQVLNLMDGQLYTTTMLAEESRKPTVQLNEGCERFIQLLLTTASQGRDLTQTFRNVGKSRGERPCSLKRAAEEAVKLHKYFFKDDLIDVIVDPSTDIAVDVPFLVAVFALANLISNAKDAIWKRGWIKIEAVESDQSIHCHVTNNGFEIPAPVQETLFEFGQSSKDGHYGWGLHFVKKTLMNHSGDICLAHTNATSTRFTIDFPRKPPARDLPIS
jgi:signal transduction histidine kinase